MNFDSLRIALPDDTSHFEQILADFESGRVDYESTLTALTALYHRIYATSESVESEFLCDWLRYALRQLHKTHSTNSTIAAIANDDDIRVDHIIERESAQDEIIQTIHSLRPLQQQLRQLCSAYLDKYGPDDFIRQHFQDLDDDN